MPARMRRRANRFIAWFVQILALAGLALVGGLLSLVLVQAHRTNKSLGLLDRNFKGDMVATSAVHRLLAAIEDPDDDLEQRVGIGGSAYRLEPGEPVWLAIEGETGKLDALRADIAIVARYLERSGLSPAAMPSILPALTQARREDNAPGALEALQVVLARLGIGDRVDEDFTARSGLTGIDPMLANERVLRAIPDLTEADVSNVVRARASGEAPIDLGPGISSKGGRCSRLWLGWSGARPSTMSSGYRSRSRPGAGRRCSAASASWTAIRQRAAS